MPEPDCAVRVLLPDALRRLFPGMPGAVTAPPGDVASVIASLDLCWPGVRDRLQDTRPSLRRHLNVFVDGERARLDTTVAAGAEVVVMTAMSGG